jgi:hypothetical protein
MAAYDKLRILWIDDREADDPTYQYPEPELPKEYEPYFTIIRHPRGGLSSVRNPQEFSDLFGPFWAGVDRESFPAEIIAMDYVLSKWSPEEIKSRSDRKTEDDRFNQVDQANRSTGLRTDIPRSADGRIVGFEGLMIGIFYASLTCDYPAGLVPMTNYGDLMEGVNEVRALHAMSKPLLDIDYSNFGVSGTDRSWRNVLSQGLKSLRYRITSLFLSRRIILSLANIVAMKGDPDEAVLTIRSNYGTRRLPVAGLFADVAEPSERVRQIVVWSEELLTEAGDEDPFEAIAEASSVAEAHWSRYLKNTAVIEERWRLSELCASKKHTTAFSDDDELQRLVDAHGANGPVKPPEKMWEGWSLGRKDRVLSVCDDSTDGLVARWASVFVLARLIAHLIRAQSGLNSKSGVVSGSCFSHFCSRDWLYALMPSPESPLILPAHHQGRNNPASAGGTLNRKLRRLNSSHLPATGDDNVGNCGFDCEHVFAGRGKGGGDLGLRLVERRLLEAAVMDHLVEAGIDGEELEEFRARLPLSLRTILQGAQA